MQKKSPKNLGISLLVALGASLFMLSLMSVMILGVKKSLEKNTNVERSQQLFYGIESGMEAALYHHNARGAGVHFVQDNKNAQKINLDRLGIETYWKIFGRVQDEYYGILQPGKKSEIRLFQDNALTPDQASDRQASSKLDIKIEFLTDLVSFPVAKQKAIKEQFGDIDLSSITGNLGDPTSSEILVGWKIVQEDNSGQIKTWNPKSNANEIDNCISENGAFFCEERLLFGYDIQSSETFNGRVIPGLVTTDLATFSQDGGFYTLSLQPLLDFEDDNANKFPGIPFRVEQLSLGGITTDTFTIESEANMGNFSHKIAVEIPEKTSIGAFDYVIFD